MREGMGVLKRKDGPGGDSDGISEIREVFWGRKWGFEGGGVSRREGDFGFGSDWDWGHGRCTEWIIIIFPIG